MTAFDFLYGPPAKGEQLETDREPYFTLRDVDLSTALSSEAITLSARWSGTITHVGIQVVTLTGNPPAYNVGAVQLDANGNPSANPFGGSAIASYDFPAVGWYWVQLPTPATVTAGDILSLRIWPGEPAPDFSNYITVPSTGAIGGDLGYLQREMYYRWAPPAWVDMPAIIPGFAGLYSSGQMIGFPPSSYEADMYDAADTPDEVGCVIELPFGATCYGARVSFMSFDSNVTSSFTVCLYDEDDNLLASNAIDDKVLVDAANDYADIDLHWEPVRLVAATYRLTILARHATEVVVPFGFVFDSSAEREQGVPEGPRWQKTERTDGGSWTDTDDELTWMGLWLSDLEETPTVTAVPPRVSYHRSVYLPISLWKPTISSYDPRGEWVTSLEAWDSYQHTITRVGGFWSAEFTVSGDMADVDWWLDEGLGLHVEVHGEDQVLVWEGFVDQVEATVGPLMVTRGPLMDVINRLQLRYTQVNLGGGVVGDTWEPGIAAWHDDDDSIARYGYIWQLVQGDRLLAVEAPQLAQVYRDDRAWPRTSKQWSAPGEQQPSVRVACRGYAAFMDRYPYRSADAAGAQVDAKLAAILDTLTEWNGLFASTNADIAANTVTTKSFEDEQRSAWSIVQEIVRLGGPAAASYGRYSLGVYDGRRVVYEPWPTELDYRQRIADPHLRTETAGGLEVMPWNVRPGRWLMFPDLLVGRVPPGTSFDRDQRVMMIREVTYRAPYGLEMTQEDPDVTEGYVAQIALRNQAW